MVKGDRGTQMAIVVALILFMLFIVPQTIAASVEDWRDTPLPILIEHSLIRLIILSIPVLIIRMLLVQGRHWNQVNYRRQMAASWGFAARVPLAQPHPLPNVGALPMPFNIKLKVQWPLFLISSLLCVGASPFFLTMLSLIVTGDFKESLQLSLHGMSLIASLTWSFAITVNVLLWWLLPRQIDITSEGLIVGIAFHIWPGSIWRPRRWQSTIRWTEARLFAVRDGKPGTPATHYELASPYTVVQWRRIRRPRWWSLYRPAIPYAEYDAQMEALIALISGVTGLPLYDVR